MSTFSGMSIYQKMQKILTRLNVLDENRRLAENTFGKESETYKNLSTQVLEAHSEYSELFHKEFTEVTVDKTLSPEARDIQIYKEIYNKLHGINHRSLNFQLIQRCVGTEIPDRSDNKI